MIEDSEESKLFALPLEATQLPPQARAGRLRLLSQDEVTRVRPTLLSPGSGVMKFLRQSLAPTAVE